MESVPTGNEEVLRVAVVVAFAPVPLVTSIAVPRVTPALVKVTVPVGDAEAPAMVGTVKVLSINGKKPGEPGYPLP